MNKKIARSFFSLAMALLMVLSLAVIPSSAAKASLNKSSVTIATGHSVTLTVNGTNKRVTWSSDDTSVAEVSKKGRVTGKKLGTATISASFGSSVLKCAVTVKAGTVSTNVNKLSVDVKKSALISVKAVGIHDLAVTSSNNSVAKAELSGKFDGDVTEVCVNGVSDGTAKLKIYAKGYEKSIYKYVEVNVGTGKPVKALTVSGITVSADYVELNENLTEKITVKASASVLEKLTIVSTAKHKFDIDTKNNGSSIDVTIKGYAEGEANLHIFDLNDSKTDIYIPVTVTNNAYDVVVWNREPKKRASTDVIYSMNDGKTTNFYILEPKDGDPAHAATLLAKKAERYEYWTLYESRPKKINTDDVIVSKSGNYNGKKSTRYLLVEKDYDEAYSNSVFGQYFGEYDYYKVYVSSPQLPVYGDSSFIFKCEIGSRGEKELRYIPIPLDYDILKIQSVWKTYIEKYKIDNWKLIYPYNTVLSM